MLIDCTWAPRCSELRHWLNFCWRTENALDASCNIFCFESPKSRRTSISSLSNYNHIIISSGRLLRWQNPAMNNYPLPCTTIYHQSSANLPDSDYWLSRKGTALTLNHRYRVAHLTLNHHSGRAHLRIEKRLSCRCRHSLLMTVRHTLHSLILGSHDFRYRISS